MKRVTTLIPVRAVRLDRTPLDRKTLKYALVYRLAEWERGRPPFPPIKVAKLPQGGFVIRDGRHRVTAAKLAGLNFILARFHEAPLRYDGATFFSRTAERVSLFMHSMMTGRPSRLKVSPTESFCDAVTTPATSNGATLSLRARPTSQS